MFEAGDDHLRLLFEFGLGRGDGGPWRRRLGEAQQTPAVMLADQLIWAVQAGRRDRVALLLSHGVDPNHPGSGHPTHQGRTALRVGAAQRQHRAGRSAGRRRRPASRRPGSRRPAAGGGPGRGRGRGPQRRSPAAGRGPAAAAGGGGRGGRAAPAGGGSAAGRRPGSAVDGDGRTTPLHSAAYEGDLELARLLVELGADVEPGGSDLPFDPGRLGRARPRRRGGGLPTVGQLSQAHSSRPTRSS